MKLYTVREAADLLRIKPQAIRRRIKGKRLLATRPKGGKAWLIPESALKAVVNEGVHT